MPLSSKHMALPLSNAPGSASRKSPGPAIGCETSFELNNVNSVDEAPYKASRTFKVLEYDDEHDIHASES